MEFLTRSLLIAAFCACFYPSNQLVAQCNDPSAPGMGVQGCHEAPLFCTEADLDGYCSELPFGAGAGICPATFCGSCENYQWISFAATNPELILEITPFNCIGTPMGSGVQAQIFSTSNCANFTPISNCESPGVVSPIVLTASNLQPGAVYYLLLDGWAGDVCEYEIVVLSPYDDNNIPVIPGPMDGASQVTIGSTQPYSVFSAANAVSYNWQITPPIGQVASGQGSENVEIDWTSTGFAQVCATPSNACGDGPPVCLPVNVLPPPMTTVQAEFCLGDCYFYNGNSYCVPGVYVEVFDTPSGDSIVTLLLTAIPPIIQVVQETLCAGQSIEICGETITSTGGYQCTYESYQGCDSLVTYIINATTGTEDFTNLRDTICENQVYLFGDEELSETGVYLMTFSNQEGCDSIVKLKLWVLPGMSSQTFLDTTICQFDTLVMGNGIYLTTEGVHDVVYSGTNGCDSIVTVNLTLEPVASSSETDYICAGAPFYQYPSGPVFTEPGNYLIYFDIGEECDSVVQLTLLEGGFFKEISKTRCFDRPITFQGVTYDEDGAYLIDLPSSGPCDSTILLNLTFLPELLLSDVDITPAGTADMGAIDITVSGGSAPYTYQWSTGASTEDISGLEEGNYTLIVTDSENCDITLAFNVPAMIVAPDARNTEQFQLQYRLSPNPVFAGQQLQVNLLPGVDLSSLQRIELINVHGEILETYTTPESQLLRLNAPTSAGLYLLRLTDTNGREKLEKIIVL